MSETTPYMQSMFDAQGIVHDIRNLNGGEMVQHIAKVLRTERAQAADLDALRAENAKLREALDLALESIAAYHMIECPRCHAYSNVIHVCWKCGFDNTDKQARAALGLKPPSR